AGGDSEAILDPGCSLSSSRSSAAPTYSYSGHPRRYSESGRGMRCATRRDYGAGPGINSAPVEVSMRHGVGGCALAVLLAGAGAGGGGGGGGGGGRGPGGRGQGRARPPRAVGPGRATTR